MEPLGDNYKANGYTWEILRREGDVCLARMDIFDRYEVFIVKKHPAATIMGKDYPEREGVPSNEEWGTLGWSIITEERALDLFNRLVKRQSVTLRQDAVTDDHG